MEVINDGDGEVISGGGGGGEIIGDDGGGGGGGSGDITGGVGVGGEVMTCDAGRLQDKQNRRSDDPHFPQQPAGVLLLS